MKCAPRSTSSRLDGARSSQDTQEPMQGKEWAIAGRCTCFGGIPEAFILSMPCTDGPRRSNSMITKPTSVRQERNAGITRSSCGLEHGVSVVQKRRATMGMISWFAPILRQVISEEKDHIKQGGWKLEILRDLFFFYYYFWVIVCRSLLNWYETSYLQL